MKNTLFTVLGPQLAQLERAIEKLLPETTDAQFLAIVNDFGTGRLRVYVSDRCFDPETLSVTFTDSDVMRMLRRRSPVLPDKSELLRLKVDLGLDESAFQDVCSALTLIENHLEAVRRGGIAPTLRIEVSPVTAWCLANCPGPSISGARHFQPDFYLLDGCQDRFDSTAAFMVDLSCGDVLLGVRSSETMAVDPLTVRSFIDHAIDELPTFPQVSAVGDPADVLADLLLDRLFVRQSAVQIYIPLYDAIFLTGVMIVSLGTTPSELRRWDAGIRAKIASFLFGAALDLTRVIFLGRQRIAMDSLGRGIALDRTPESFDRITRIMRLVQPIYSCAPRGDDELTVTYQPRYLPSTIDIDATSFNVEARSGTVDKSPAYGGDNPRLTLLQEQITHILQYNHMLLRERREVIKWVSHTIAGRLADLGRAISADQSDFKIARRRFNSVNIVFDAARYVTRGEKYRPPDIVQFDPETIGESLAEYLIGECSENMRLVETLRGSVLWGVFKETTTFEQARERLRHLAHNQQLFTITPISGSDASPVRTSTSILNALIQEVTLNALEYNDWQRTPWTPVAIELDAIKGQVSVTNSFAPAKIANVQALKAGFDAGDGSAMSMGLTLVSELYGPAVCKQAYFEVHRERMADGPAGAAGDLTFRARLKSL